MAKKSTFGVNTYRYRSKPKIGRHKKRMNKSEKRNYKPYIGQGRAWQISLDILYITHRKEKYDKSTNKWNKKI